MMESPYFDAAIIGGGSAGLAASVFLARKWSGKHSVVLLEKGPRVGRKLLATGNGTCNMSNAHAGKRYYHGKDPLFIETAMNAFPPEKTCEFFRSIGVESIKRENGRIYPLCEQAGAVLDCLRLEMQALGVNECCSSPVSGIRPERTGFRLILGSESIKAGRVLVCTGGAASPSLGGSADAYTLLTDLGHTRTPLFPSIVQVKTDNRFIKAAKGVRVGAGIAFYLDGKKLAEEQGEVLFTDYGLSGPAVMQGSRCVSDWERRRIGNMTALLNLLPDMEEENLLRSLQNRAKLKERTFGDLLTGLLQKRLGQTVMRAAGYGALSSPVSELSDNDLEKIAAAITHWEIPVLGTQGMGGAQVTAGGIATAEFNPQTLESCKVPGLYAAGEVLDIDGDCGGFNLQWAWASAFLAAASIAHSYK